MNYYREPVILATPTRTAWHWQHEAATRWHNSGKKESEAYPGQHRQGKVLAQLADLAKQLRNAAMDMENRGEQGHKQDTSPE